MMACFCGILKFKKKRCQTHNFLAPRLLRERERESLYRRENFLLSMLYKQLSACTLLLCDVKLTCVYTADSKLGKKGDSDDTAVTE